MALPRIKFAGGGERFQYLTHKGNDTTIRFLLRYPGVLDADILCAAVKQIVESVDILHSTFFTGPNLAYWQVNRDLEEHHYFRRIETTGDPMITARSLSVFPVEHQGKAQLRCELVTGEQESVIVLLISHLCVDGGDGKYLLNKLIEAYNLILTEDSAASLSVKNSSRAPEQVYENKSLKDVKDMMKMPLTPGGSAYPFPTEDPGTRRVTTAVIPESTMSAARKKAKAIGATANDLLLAAAYQGYAAFEHVEPGAAVSISSMMDLRRHCKDGESDGLCNMSGGLPTTLPDGVPGSFCDTLTEIARQTAAAKNDPVAGMGFLPVLHTIARGIPVWMQMLAAEKAYGAMPVGLTNLGSLRSADLALGGIAPTEAAFGGPLKKKNGFQISIISLDGVCTLACYGQYTAEDQAHIQKTLDSMAAVLADYAAI